jgi:hypothetical protein
LEHVVKGVGEKTSSWNYGVSTKERKKAQKKY